MKKASRILALCLAVVLLATTVGTISIAEGGDIRKLSLICRAQTTPDLPLNERDKNLCYQAFEKELLARNIEIEYELVDDASIADVVRTRLAAQVDVPDIISDAWIGISESEIMSWAENGLLVNIREIVDKYDEDGSIFKFYEDHAPGVLGAVTAADGGLYWFSYLNAPTYVEADGTPIEYQGNPYQPLIRADWLEKVGKEYKKVMTHEELFDDLLAIQEGDANGNGVQDEVMAIGISGFGNGIARSFGLSSLLLCDVDPETGLIMSNLYKPEFKDYIAFMNKCYEAGLYDTTALSNSIINELIADNKASLAHHYAEWDSFESTISAVDDAVYAPVMIMNADGKTYSSVDPTFGHNCHFMISSSCQELEAVVDLFDYIYTDEYALLDQMGIEGLSFEYNEYGIPQSLWDPNTQPVNWEGATLYCIVGLIAFPAVDTGYSIFNREVYPDYRKLKREYLIWFQDEGGRTAIKETWGTLSTKLALPTNEEMEKTGQIENVLNTYMRELLTDLILGNRSINDLSKYIEELESLGLTDYIEIMQARRDRFVEAVGTH